MPQEDIARKFYKFGFNWFVDLFILVLADNKGRFAILIIECQILKIYH